MVISGRACSGSASSIAAGPRPPPEYLRRRAESPWSRGRLWWSEQRTALIVATMQQDGQKQAMIDVAGVQQRRPRRQPEPHRGVETPAPGTRIDVAIGLTPVHWRELVRRGRKGLADLVMAQCDGGDRRELRRVAVVERIGINGEQRADPVERTHRHRSGHDRGDVTVEHGIAGGGRMPVEARLKPSLELRKGHGGGCHRRRSFAATLPHAARRCAAFQFQASSSCS